MRIIPIASIVSALVVPAAAQEPERRGSVGVAMIHAAGDDRRLPIGGFDATFRVGRFDVQATYHRLTERYDYDLSDPWTRTIEWYSGGIIWPVSPSPAWFRPHLLTGFLLMRDTTSDGDFPHRRPAVYGGLGVDFPLGWRVYARAQYLTAAVYVYEQVYFGHMARASVGIGF